MVVRPFIPWLLALAVLAAGAYCPCPAMAAKRAAGVSARVQGEAPKSCCAATKHVESKSTPAPEKERSNPCQHCDGVAAVTGAMSKDKQEKTDFAPVVLVAMLAPLALDTVPTLDVAPLIRRSRDAVIHASPPDLRAVVCSFIN